MVVIRLSRTGISGRSCYRVVVADKRRSRDGGFIERLGSYDPGSGSRGLTLDLDRIGHWVGRGAVLSERVSGLIRRYRRDIRSA